MKILFLTADLGGNVPPTLAVAEELTRRGVDVEVAGLKDGHTAFHQPPFRVAVAVGVKGPAKSPGAMFRLLASRRTSAEVAELVAERRPDLVVVDCMLPAPIRGALRGDVPVVVLFHTFGAYWTRSFDRGPFGRILAPLGLRPSRLWARAAARLLLTDAELDPGRDDPALAGSVWTGTTEKGEQQLPRQDGARPRVLVALSSTNWPGMLPVYRRIVAALSELPVDAVVTTGGVDLGAELDGAANVEILGWADHGALLPTMDLMIGHGGHSSTMKSLAHGVPLLVLPINPTADQRLIGQTLTDAGLGAWLPKSAAPEKIRDATRRILADGELRARIAATGDRFRAHTPGSQIAADALIAVSTRDPHPL
ncbi:glycosyltransferase [Stackebrandtia nassauensis]|uniref:Glycosyltransferase, MGT family n=1 Tax=Stackebrandtia nassauensis (strain DSM 44728 / CIP 108903 / NRRL B-16338 / NBRC 102104 / LLR-40K-21) TaxID=446470 RepID=D3PWJ7_STANL|nr:nucleotide disphospho-sugar-binding domain-containing protein [Stackebrandtia nassauensis]ADD43219.1 glycosyltransferase, MGT family [Stackebrandtia nassauensis DSM 44728]